MHLLYFLPLLLRSIFTLQTTPSSSEFVLISLQIDQWFYVNKSVFGSTMSPMQNFHEILTNFWRPCKVWINFFLDVLQNSSLRCWILLQLLLRYKPGFWKIPGGGITTFVFVASMLFGDINFGICPSLIVSTVSGLEFIIASVSVFSVCRDSLSKLSPYVCSRGFKIALTDLIWCYQMAGCLWIPFPSNPVSTMVLEEVFYLVLVHFTKCF